MTNKITSVAFLKNISPHAVFTFVILFNATVKQG